MCFQTSLGLSLGTYSLTGHFFVYLVAGQLWTSLTWANPQTGSPARVHLDNGRQALEGNHFRDAKIQFELALKADPTLAEAYLQLGTVEFRVEDISSAIQNFRKYLELQPGSSEGHYRLALALLRGQNLSEGCLELERTVSLNPQHVDAAYNLSVVLLEMGRTDEALRRLKALPESSRNRPDVAFNLVRAELAANHLERAKEEAERGIGHFGDDATWLMGVGQLFLSHHQAKEAIRALEAAFRLQPRSEEIRRQLAAAYIEAREPGLAVDLLKSATSAEDHYLSASAYLVQRRLSEAFDQSQRALKQAPHEPRYLLQQARITQRLGDHQKCLEILSQISKAQPEWAEPYYSAGVSYYLLRRYEEARQFLGHALELDSNSKRALFLYAASLANEGRNREGERYLLRAIALDPSNARFRYHLGAMRLRDNRPAEARQSFEEAIRLRPTYALPHYQLGKLLVNSNQLAEAVQELEAAVECQPDLAQAFYHLGRLYARTGDKEKSARALERFQQLKKTEASEDQEFQQNLRMEVEQDDR
ncbi:MAG: tetratricopeptide repeat protein [Acidobacteriota bacterium]